MHWIAQRAFRTTVKMNRPAAINVTHSVAVAITLAGNDKMAVRIADRPAGLALAVFCPPRVVDSHHRHIERPSPCLILAAGLGPSRAVRNGRYHLLRSCRLRDDQSNFADARCTVNRLTTLHTLDGMLAGRKPAHIAAIRSDRPPF